LPNRDTHSDCYAHGNCYRNSESHRDCYGISLGDPDSNRHSNGDGDTRGNCGS
jgi:hypothetical protein